MPTVNGTTQRGGQLILGYGTISVPQFEVLFPALRNLPPQRLGYGWVIVRDNASPNNKRVIQQGAIAQPGRFITFVNQYGFSAVQYGWFIEWNVAGLAYTASFT